MRIAPAITLSSEERTVLESQARSRSLPVRVAERARIVLFAASGQQDKEIAARMAITPKKVSRWRKRFLAGHGQNRVAKGHQNAEQTQQRQSVSLQEA